MSWTAPATVTTGDLITAAQWNTQIRDNMLFVGGIRAGGSGAANDINGFTNTGYADLDALTTVSGTAVTVTCDTLTTAVVILSAAGLTNTTASQVARLGYRVSGASTIAASDAVTATGGDDTSIDGAASPTYVHFQNGLTAGTNVFELQARVSANAGRLTHPTLTVIPLTT